MKLLKIVGVGIVGFVLMMMTLDVVFPGWSEPTFTPTVYAVPSGSTLPSCTVAAYRVYGAYSDPATREMWSAFARQAGQCQ